MALTDLQVAAALDEQVYRRAAGDQPLSDGDIGATGISVGVSGLTQDGNTAYYYNNATGFVGRIVQANGKVFVVLRGTDMAGSLADILAAEAGYNSSNSIDINDFNFANLPLGRGTTGVTQYDDALALTQAALAIAGSRQVVVTGQSLGAGLAGLVSANLNLESYLIAPAPFQNQLDIQATLFALQKNGIPLSDLKSGTATVDDTVLVAGGQSLRNWIHAFRPQYDSSMDAVIADATSRLAVLENNLRARAHVYSNVGEALTSTGAGSVGGFVSAFADKFNISRTTMDLGEGNQISLHGPALHNLAIRTMGSAQDIASLFKSDKALRASFLDNTGVAGAIDGPRADPAGSSSKMPSSGPNPAIFEDALWKTFGVTDGFYDRFYTRFGDWLSLGAVADGKSATTDNSFSVHTAVVQLGLQVVRDAINRTTQGPIVSDKGLNVFGTDPTTSGRVMVDLSDITATDPANKDLPVNKPFGVRLIDSYVWDQARFQPSTILNAASAVKVVRDALGIPGQADPTADIHAGLLSLPAWQVLVVQAGSANGALNYTASGDQAAKSHVIIGGTAGDTITGSTVRDYILGGDGNDTLMSGGGNDALIGGAGDDRYIAKPLTTQLSGNVTFIGGPGNDTAVYGNEFAGFRLDLVVKYVDRLAGQVVAQMQVGSTVVDTLIGIERVEFGSAADHADFTDVANILKLKVSMGTGSNEVNRIKETNAAPADPAVPQKGAFTTFEFSTQGVTGPQQQTLSTSSDFDAKERANAVIVVNGHQLVGGATFDFDRFDMISSGNLKPIWLMNSSKTYPFVASQDQVQRWTDEQVDAAVKFFDGISGNLPGVATVSMGPLLGFAFAPILYGELLHFKESWESAYFQRIVGVYGELYDLGTVAQDGTRTLTITLNPTTDGADETIVINNWKQGDYGIQIDQLAFNHGLDSGTNKNGQLDSWQSVSLSTIRARLAEVGITSNDQATPGSGGGGGGGGGGSSGFAARALDAPLALDTEAPAPLVRIGNDSDNEIAGGLGDDLLRGYQGNDDLLGDEGRDIYVFAAGDGADIIEDLFLGGNIIRFLDGLDIASIVKQLVFDDDGNFDLQVTYGFGDSILIKDWSTLSGDEQALWTFESVTGTFTPADSADEPDLSVEPDIVGGIAPAFVAGTDGNDVITGIDIDERIDAFAGNDVINAGGGNDIVNAGDGNDTVDGGSGNDFMPGGNGDDVLNGGAGNDSIGGGDGNDIIRGGTGNDYLEAGTGTDTYVFERGDGHDTISAVNPNTINDDTLQFGTGINPADIVITRAASDSVFDANPVAQREFTFTLRGTQDSVKLQDDVRFFGNGFSGDVDLNAITVGQIVFDNGVVWTRQDIAAQYFAQAATSGDDTIVGFDGNETFNGKGGNDRLYGYAGSDTYVWNRGDGNDVIIDTPLQTNSDIDRLVLGAGITTADLAFSRAVDSFGSPFGDLTIAIGGANGGTLTIVGYFQDPTNGIEKIAFADGTVWNRTDIDGHYLSQHITSGNDSVFGTAGNDSIDGGAGNDTISGSGGNDTMNGGAGNDRLIGSSGIDVYRFDANFGQDAVFDNGPGLGDPSPPFSNGALGQDRIEFTAYNLADFTFARAGVGNADLVLSRIGSTDQVTIEQFTHFAGAVDYLKFADGTQLYWPDTTLLVDRTAAASNVINGTAAAELITGTAVADRIFAGAGLDTINAGGGNDVVNAGDGDDRVNGEAGDDILLAGAGNDVVSGGDGNDIIYADAGNDFVTGDAGADTIVGGGGDDSLNGGADNDTVYGNAGNDTLAGGTGADILIGGAGNDTYVFNRGDGQDVIQPATERALGETETLVLGGGITAAELQYALVGNDLVISFGATPTDRLTVTDFLRIGTLTSVVVGATTLTVQQILESITGTTTAADNVTPFATGENTTLLYGGRGNDTLTGDGTDNTYIFIRGDGQDHIDNRKFFFDFSNDQLFIDGYAPGDLRLARGGTNGLDLALTFTTGTDRIDINQQLGDDLFAGVTTIHFEDGTTWSQNDLRARVLAQAATAGNDSIAGFDGFDGNDDVLDGGLGNDTLSGGLGNDRYVVNAGEGQDVIIDVSGPNDRLELGSGIRPTGITVARSATDANDAVLTFSATDFVTLKGVFSDATTGVDVITFADGTIWTKTDLANAVLAGKTTAAADTITGTFLGETLAGGLGNDTLSGGAGGDTYLFNRGDGQDTVIELGTDGQDRLLLGAGITTAQVTVRKGTVDPTDLIVDIGGGETVTLKGELSGGTAGVEAIIFADGTAWGHLDIDKKLLALSQTAGADSITGSAATDVITGGAGNDVIDGRGGADVYVFSRGDGQDTIADTGAGSGLDSIAFGANIGAGDIDLSHGANPNDLVIAIRGTTDRITVKDHFAAGGGKIGEIILKDGTALFAADIAGLADNHAPTVAVPIATKTVAQNAAFNFTVPFNTFADADVDDFIDLTAKRADGTALPSWLKFDGETFTGTPANADVGTPILVRLTATDSAGDSVTSDFTINVTNVNDAPVSTALIANKRATVGTAFSFALPANQFVDPDAGLPGVPAQTLTYSAKLGSGAALPTWLTFNATTRTFSGTPATANQGAVDVVVTASDGTASGTTRFGIFVGTTGNTNPTVGTAMATQTATEDSAFSYQVPANAFADTTAGDRLRYTAALSTGAALPTWLVLDPITGLFTGTPANANVGTSTVRVTATDIFGSAVSANFTLRVNNINDAPVANGVLDNFLMSQNTPFTYTIPAGFFTDVDSGDALFLFANLADGSPLPDWLVFNPATRTFSGTPANGDVGMLDIIVGAADRAGLVATTEMFILIGGVNDAPVVSHPLPALAVDRTQPFTFTVPAGTFSDDGGGVGLTARMTDGSALPTWMTFDPLTRTFSGTPDLGSVGDNEGVHLYRVAVIATDSEGASTSTIFNLAVRGPNPGTLIFGSEGNDTLNGTLGPDQIYGLGGNDSMQGREGADTYAFDRGFGHDTIAGFYNDQSGNQIKTTDDIIRFGAGIAPSDITVAYGDSFATSIFFNSSDPTIIDSFYKFDMTLTVAGTNDSIRIERQLEEDRFVNFRHPIEEVHFADGTVWTAADLTNKVTTGGAGNDLLAGDSLGNLMSGGAGNDRLVGMDGNDTLIGGTGNDDLYGFGGDDVYVFNLGDGQDRIMDVSQFQFFFNSFDTLRFGTGIRPSDLQFVRDTRDPFSFSTPADGGSLLVKIGGTTDSIKIYRQYAVVNDLSAGIDQFEFADGTVMNRAQIDQLVNPGNLIQGTDAAETLTGTAASETINGKKGNDLLQGADGNDTYIWNLGDGNDTISEFGITSTDVVNFGIGIRPQDITLSHIGDFGSEAQGYYLYMTFAPTGEKLTIAWEFNTNSFGQPLPSIEEFRFSDGTVWTQDTFINLALASTPGNDIIQGFPNRPDVMDGGAGNDELHGQTGADTYVFGRGYGNDTIYDALDGIFQNVVDNIQFNNTVSSTDVAISRVSHVVSGNGRVIDTVFSINGTTDKLTVAGRGFGFEGDVFTSITFAGDFGFWSGSSLGAHYLAQNSTSGNDSIIGFAANEVISTGLGNDTLDGGVGSDTLIGGAGDDTYVFWRRNEKIFIRDAGNVSDIDTLQLMPDILPAEVTIVRAANENDLIVNINAPFDGQIVLQGRLIGADRSADQIRFSDNTVWDFATILSRAQAAAADARLVNGTAAAEAIAGTDFAETFNSKAGNDTITGGFGEDIYIWRTGYGNDVITEVSSSTETDTLKLRDLTSSQVTLLQSGNDLIILANPTGEHITIKDQFNFSGVFGIEEILFSDRIVWDRNALSVTAGFAGTDLADSLLGSFGDDVLAGLGGNDTIDGSFGTDTAVFGGNWRDFAITYNSGTAAFTLSDRRVGVPEGVDSVVNVERFQFADRTITVSTPADLLNDAPTDITVTGGAVEENSGAGTVVGTLTSVDDPGDSATFAAVSGAIDKFDVVGNQILVKAGANLDFETATSHQLGIRVTDSGGLTFTKTVTITIIDVDETGIIGTGGADVLTGTAAADRISGFAGNDTLIGGGGADTLNGGSEFDIASYSNATVGVTANLTTPALNTGDAAGDVYSSIEGLIGSGFNDVLTGDLNANTIAGGAGNDTIDGGAGNDTLTGGAGNDVFIVDAAGDVVTENLSEGTDEVRTALAAYTLGANLENLTYTGAAAFAGTGNTLANVITGGIGNDTLDGGTGSDTLVGGAGNDIYLVDVASDVVTEGVGAGTDEVRTALASLYAGRQRRESHLHRRRGLCRHRQCARQHHHRRCRQRHAGRRRRQRHADRRRRQRRLCGGCPRRRDH